MSKDPDVIIGFYERNGYKIFYEKVGHGEHVICVFSGAVGNARIDFTHQFEEFDKEKFTLIGWDRPGFGLSRPPERDYTKHVTDRSFYEFDAEYAIALMQFLGYENFSVMGWCDGSKTAMITAILYPAKVDKIVILGASAYFPEEMKEKVVHLTDLEAWDDDELERYTAMYGRKTLEKLWYEHVKFQLTVGNVFHGKLQDIKCPTFILYGAKDQIVTRQMFEYLSTNIPDVETYIFQDGGHYLQNEHPRMFNDLVQRFLLD